MAWDGMGPLPSSAERAAQTETRLCRPMQCSQPSPSPHLTCRGSPQEPYVWQKDSAMLQGQLPELLLPGGTAACEPSCTAPQRPLPAHLLPQLWVLPESPAWHQLEPSAGARARPAVGWDLSALQLPPSQARFMAREAAARASEPCSNYC